MIAGREEADGARLEPDRTCRDRIRRGDSLPVGAVGPPAAQLPPLGHAELCRAGASAREWRTSGPVRRLLPAGNTPVDRTAAEPLWRSSVRALGGVRCVGAAVEPDAVLRLAARSRS